MRGYEGIEDIDLIREFIDRDMKADIETEKAIISLNEFNRTNRIDFLRFLKKAMDVGTEIQEGWSNFMFNRMYTINKNHYYDHKTCGSNSLSFLLKEGFEITNGDFVGHETVYDMNKGVWRTWQKGSIRLS